MSFSNFHRVIQENDTVILYIGFNDLHAIEVKGTVRNKHGVEVPNMFQTRYGALKVISLVGLEFGSRVQLSNGWALVLYPTPELWTLTLPHRTQILYTTDISMVIGRLNVGPGSVVCEAGTGSGSMSHAFLRAIGPTGHLHTADFHKDRVEVAVEEFTRHGLAERVTVTHADICVDGWPVTAVADAVFLDVPRPYAAIHHAVNAIKITGGRMCTFSPCIEQVAKNCCVLRQLGLQQIRTFEVLNRDLQVKPLKLNVIKIEQFPYDFSKSNSAEEIASKRIRLDEEREGFSDSFEDAVQLPDSEKASDSPPAGEPGSLDVNASVNGSEKVSQCQNILATLPMVKQPGHTGYLTFCFVPPNLPRPVVSFEFR